MNSGHKKDRISRIFSVGDVWKRGEVCPVSHARPSSALDCWIGQTGKNVNLELICFFPLRTDNK